MTLDDYWDDEEDEDDDDYEDAPELVDAIHSHCIRCAGTLFEPSKCQFNKCPLFAYKPQRTT